MATIAVYCMRSASRVCASCVLPGLGVLPPDARRSGAEAAARGRTQGAAAGSCKAQSHSVRLYRLGHSSSLSGFVGTLERHVGSAAAFAWSIGRNGRIANDHPTSLRRSERKKVRTHLRARMRACHMRVLRMLRTGTLLRRGTPSEPLLPSSACSYCFFSVPC